MSNSAAEFASAKSGALDLFDDEIADARQAFAQAGIDDLELSDNPGPAQLRLALCCSPYIASVAERYGGTWFAELKRYDGMLPDESTMHRELDNRCAEIELEDQNTYMQQLREYRNLTLATIALYDLGCVVPVSDILRSLSDLAAVCIAHAVSRAESVLSLRYGSALSEDGSSQSLLVVAMGKLGGRELNFSSDVDLVFLHRESGETDGKKSVDNEDYFRRVGQLAIRFLDSVTSEGFVYRVDMRLRPLGRSGPLVINLDAMENYLVTQGRDWERFAWIKARAICGSAEDIDSLQALLKPFIYRRYLDYSVFDSLRDLKHQIGVKVNSEGAGDDIKLGRGGIREIEFIAQSFQLVRGGREPSLQQTGLRGALEVACELGLLDSTEMGQLLDAYYFLRRVENHLQMVSDQQTHALPDTDHERQRLALSLCYANYQDFERELRAVQDFVQNQFDQVFSITNTDDARDSLSDVCLQLRAVENISDRHSQLLTDAGFADAAGIAEILHELYHSGRYQRYPARARELIDELIPVSLKLLGQSQLEAGQKTPDAKSSDVSNETLKKLLELFHTVSGRSGYLQLLADSEETLANLLRLMRRSPWLAVYVASHPMVLDELLNISRISVVETVAENVVALKSELAQADPDDLGELMDRVRHFQQARTVRIAAADISGNLSVKKVSDALTWLAEAVLQVTTGIVKSEMEHRHGVARYELDGKSVVAEFSVIAYGKLGGIELGYSSDLDIVFLYHSEGKEQVSDGKKSLENQVYFSRLAQKLVHFLTTLTPAGVLYEIDTRLRPNGRSGVLVTSMAAFRDYQLDNAWTWEHQALVRTRVVVGSESMRTQFNDIRIHVLQQGVSTESLKADVVEMRSRMRRELDRSSEANFDLKQGHGGIADIEFMVQYLVLKHARNHRELLEYSDNVRQLEGLARGGHLDSDQTSQLTDAYLYLRGLYHRQSMQLQDGVVAAGLIAETHRTAVVQCWQQLMV